MIFVRRLFIQKNIFNLGRLAPLDALFYKNLYNWRSLYARAFSQQASENIRALA